MRAAWERVLMFAGLLLATIGGLSFRKPGVPWWGVDPLWRACETLRPPGVVMWWAGWLLLLGTLVVSLLSGH